MKTIKKFTEIVLLLGVSLLLAACGIVQISVETPAATVVIEQGEPDSRQEPTAFTDLAEFQAALLHALNARNETQLQSWMTEPFLAGTWRHDLSETSPAEALKTLIGEQLGLESHLVEDTDLTGLLGGKDPLSILPVEAGVTNAFLVGGWGKDGRDETLLFVARQADNSLRLRGWMVIEGGFSGARLGGVQHFYNAAHGYSLYLPQDFEITTQPDNNMVFFGPGEGHDRGMAFITAEPANGRTTEQVYEDVKAAEGEGFNINGTPIQIEDAQAMVVTGLPGQDSNRQVFMVRNDLLYHLTFMPDDPQTGAAYQQMEDLYAIILNTFHFSP